MSRSRVLLRLEVKDDQNIVDFSYSAPDLKKKEIEDRQSSYNSARRDLKLLSKAEADASRGQRNYHNITLETYNIDMNKTAEDLKYDRSETSGFEGITMETKNIPHNSELCVITTTSGKIPKLKMDKKSSMEDEKSHANQVVRFLSGNPAVEITEGFLHLYKEQPPYDENSPASHMLCMLSIPATFCLQDLLKFLGPILCDLEMIKIVKPGTPNEYMALLKFRTVGCAFEFFEVCNNNKFNSIEADVCHLAFVAKMDCIRSQEGAGEAVSNAVELPVCAVCLEKMDESIEGVLTVLCNHSFHIPCIAQCNDTICPVCRYTLNPISMAGNKCFQCSNEEDLWICLICGEVGCGRYANGHAHRHFQQTAHTYAMQLGSNRVWDYVGENYVHRLVLNKVDGKLVEIDNELSRAALFQEEKIESLCLEYTYLLTTQLDSQREFFEHKMNIMEDQTFKEIEKIDQKLKKALEDVSKKDFVLQDCNKDKQILEKRCQLLSTKTSKLQTELEEEKEMNKCLRENQSQWQSKVVGLEEKVSQKDDAIKDLQEQLRDLMFFLDAKEKLKTTDEVTKEELEEGRIFLQPANQDKARRGKKKK